MDAHNGQQCQCWGIPPPRPSLPSPRNKLILHFGLQSIPLNEMEQVEMEFGKHGSPSCSVSSQCRESTR